ncbi:hypothetical protein SLEP1_g22903 [Rubroshorea leprosula]|uniref:Uncharacterized protein n=1 Tax=Rubroshorea leprosula TaxID=152421 RepID=A0AAV5JAK2_9ROSI|nr:hypothetical protein SLEP1_g22903 [Rubroshorea leprosula]
MTVRKTVTATTITTAQNPLQSPGLKQPLKPLLYLQQQLPQTRSIRGASSLAYAASNGYYDEHKSSSSAVAAKAVSTGVKKSSSSAIYYESSDDERHFKRKPSRYESSLPPMAEREDEPRHSKGSRERE